MKCEEVEIMNVATDYLSYFAQKDYNFTTKKKKKKHKKNTAAGEQEGGDENNDGDDNDNEEHIDRCKQYKNQFIKRLKEVVQKNKCIKKPCLFSNSGTVTENINEFRLPMDGRQLVAVEAVRPMFGNMLTYEQYIDKDLFRFQPGIIIQSFDVSGIICKPED